MPYFWLAIGVFVLAMVYVGIQGKRLPSWRPTVLWVVFLVLVGTRFYLATLINGYKVDFGWFTNWAINLQEIPFKHLYERGFYVNYPPVYLYVLWLVGKISSTMHILPITLVELWNETIPPFQTSWVVSLKTVPILADFGLAYLAYHVASRSSSRKIGVATAILILLCPAIGINSLFWAQVDSFLMLLLIFSLISLAYAIHTKKMLWWTLTAVFFILAVLTKPQALIFAPVFLAATVWHFNLKIVLIAAIAAALTLVLVCLPFSSGNVFAWTANLIASTTAQYSKITLNAYNLYFFMGLNNKPEISRIWSFIKIAIPATITLLTLVLWKIYVAKPALRSQTQVLTAIFAMGFMLMFTVFIFMPEMHERYSYPALLCLYFAFAASGQRIILPLCAVVSLTLFSNCAWLLSALKLGGNSWTHIQNIFRIEYIGLGLSLVNVLAWAFGLSVFWGITKGRERL